MGLTAYKKYLQSKKTYENILTGINKEELANLDTLVKSSPNLHIQTNFKTKLLIALVEGNFMHFICPDLLSDVSNAVFIMFFLSLLLVFLFLACCFYICLSCWYTLKAFGRLSRH
jgi:hypothetical protein